MRALHSRSLPRYRDACVTHASVRVRMRALHSALPRSRMRAVVIISAGARARRERGSSGARAARASCVCYRESSRIAFTAFVRCVPRALEVQEKHVGTTLYPTTSCAHAGVCEGEHRWTGSGDGPGPARRTPRRWPPPGRSSCRIRSEHSLVRPLRDQSFLKVP